MTFICKNICSSKIGVGRSSGHEKPDNWKIPFLSHGRCRTCQAWQRYDGRNRCLCCGSKLALRPRVQKNKDKFREMRSYCP